MDFGLTINDLQEGKRPKIPQQITEGTEKRFFAFYWEAFNNVPPIHVNTGFFISTDTS
jgi:hypothetical protein